MGLAVLHIVRINNIGLRSKNTSVALARADVQQAGIRTDSPPAPLPSRLTRPLATRTRRASRFKE
jgi:hypothetical protein